MLPPSDKAAAPALTPFHVKQRRGWIRYVELLRNGQAKNQPDRALDVPNLWTRHISNSFAAPEPGPDRKDVVDSAAAGGFPGRGVAVALADTTRRSISSWSNATPRRPPSLREALRVTGAPGTVHLADIGILWIESLARSIASLPGHWLRYIS